MATKPTLESLSSLHLMLRSPSRVENNAGYENMAYFTLCMFVKYDVNVTCLCYIYIIFYRTLCNSSELLQMAYLLFFIMKMYEHLAMSISSDRSNNCCASCRKS